VDDVSRTLTLVGLVVAGLLAFWLWRRTRGARKPA
jgi:LPXTG-motif cell wall-anchored protein